MTQTTSGTAGTAATTTVTVDTASDADRALKAKHRAIWASGDYPAVAREVVAPLGPILVEACSVRPQQHVLDVGAGTGNAAIAAAKAGARVTASDLTPELLAEGRRIAQNAGVDLEWRQGDAEALPFATAEFDTVLSSIGVMFAPHHQTAADEMLRVCRPGGTLGVLSWTPEGFIGQLFVTMKPYAPPPPPGASPPPLWGSEDHVRTLFGDRVTDVVTRTETLTVDRFATPEEFRDFFKTAYGPTIAVYGAIKDDPDQVAALDTDLVELARRFDTGTGATRLGWEYLVLTATRA